MRSIIDPVSRIEGHLRVEMEVEGGRVSQAWVSGGLFRGMELILQGREPADATVISQRICGICPVSHAHASCMAGEAATGIERLPNAGRIVRNIAEGAQFLIVTQSPILLGLPGAGILTFDDGPVHPCSYEDTGSYTITSMFLNHREKMLKQLLES